jgi:hypothetical protein
MCPTSNCINRHVKNAGETFSDYSLTLPFIHYLNGRKNILWVASNVESLQEKGGNMDKYVNN